MKKLKSTFLAVFGVLFLLCTALFAVGCSIGSSSAETPETQGSSRSSYTVSVDVNDASLGTCLLSAANDGEEYIEGTPVTVTVQPKEGYLAQLFVDGEEVSLTDNTYTFNISKDTRLAVNYSYEYYVRSDVYPGDAEVILSDPANGIRYAEGEEVTVTVKPYEGYVVGSVLLNGVAQTLTYDAENGTYTFKFNITTASYVMVACAKGCEVTVENDAEKGSVTLNGAACTADTVFTFKGGETAELSVVAKGGNTVKGVYAFDEGHPGGVLIPLENNVGTVKFTDDTVICVIYDEYYEVTATAVGGGAVRFNKQPATLGYAEGTALILTATPDTGKTVNSVTMLAEGKEVDITDKLIGNDYSFTVTEDVEFQVKFSDPKVSISFNNSAFGTYTLEGAAAKPDGTYEAGSELTLTATPSRGFKFGYFMVDGKRAEGVPIEDSDAYSYSFTVQENIEICIFFFIGTRYNVKLNADGLGGYGVTAALSEDIMGYDGEEVTVHVATEGPLPAGKAVFYSIGGGARKLLVGDSFTATIEGKNLSLKVFVADLVMPVITFTDGEEYEYSVELVGGNFVITLTDPEDAEGAHFNEWIVMVNGVKADLTEDAEGKTHSFSLPYSEESGEMNVSVTVNWGELVSLTVNAGDHGTATGGGYLQKGLVSITIVPESGYRVKSVKFTSDGDGSQISLRNIDSLGSVTENFTLTVDTTVEIEYQQIFTVTFALANSDPDTATFAVTTDPSNAFSKNTGNVWTLDSGTRYAFTVTANTNYSVRSVKIGAEEKITAPADTFTLDNLTLTADVRVEVQTVALVAVSWSVVGPATLSVKNGQTELESGDMVEKGAALTVKVSLNSGLTSSDYVITLTANGDEQTTTTDTYTVTASAQTTLVATAAKKLENLPAAPSTAPSTWGTWTSMGSTAGASSEQLVFTQNTLVIGTDPVKEITTEGADGSTVYTLTTESEKSYTLSWFNQTAGYILALEERTASGIALFAARAGERTTYYLNPNLADSVLHAVADEALNGTWKADGSELTVGANAGKMTLTLDATSATYIIKVSGELYFIILSDDILPYVMTYQEGALTFDGTSYTKQTEEVEKTITGYGAADLLSDNGMKIIVRIISNDYTADEIEADIQLQIGEKKFAPCQTPVKDNNVFLTYFLISGENGVTSLNIDKYTIQLLVKGQVVSDCPVTGLSGNVKVTQGGRDYVISMEEGKFMLTISKSATEYAVSVSMTGNGSEGDFGYELKKNDGAVFNPATDKVKPTDTLTLTVKVPEGYTANVKTEHCNAVGTSEANVYTIDQFGEGAKITIAYEGGTQPEPEKSVSFNGFSVFASSLGGVDVDRMDLTVDLKGFSDATTAAKGSKLIYGTGENDYIEAIQDFTVSNVLSFNVGNIPVPENGEAYTLKILIDGMTFDVVTTAGLPAETTLHQKKYTLTKDGNNTVQLKIENVSQGGTDPQPDPEKKVTGYGGTLMDKGSFNGVDGLRIVLNIIVEGYSKSDIETSFKLKIGDKFYSYHEVAGGDKNYAVYFLVTGNENGIDKFENNVYSVELYVNDTLVSSNPCVSVESSQKSQDLGTKTYTLSVEENALKLTVSDKVVSETKLLKDFSNANIVNDSIFIRFKYEGYANSEDLRKVLKLNIDGVEVLATSLNGDVAQFLLTNNIIGTIPNGKHQLKLQTDVGEYTSICSNVDTSGNRSEYNGKIFTLTKEGDNMYLTVTDKPTEFDVKVDVSGKPDDVAEPCYELTKGGVAFTSENKLSVSETLDLQVKTTEGYRADVSVTGATLTNVGENMYTISEPTDTVTIKIVYRSASEPLGTAYGFHNVAFWADNGLDITINIWLFTTGYSIEQVQAATLKIGAFTCERYTGGGEFGQDGGNGALKHFVWFHVNDVQDVTDEKVYLVIAGEMHLVSIENFAETTKEYFGKHYSLKTNEDNQLILTVDHSSSIKKALDEADAKNKKLTDQWSYYDPENRVKETKFENNILSFTFAGHQSSSQWYVIQLYYFSSELNVGDQYTVSFTIQSSAAGSYWFFEQGAQGWNKEIKFDSPNATVNFQSETCTQSDLSTIKLYMCPKDAKEAQRIDAATITISDLKVEKITAIPGTDEGDHNDHENEAAQWTKELEMGGSVTFSASVGDVTTEDSNIAISLKVGDTLLLTFFLDHCETPNEEKWEYSDSLAEVFGAQGFSISCSDPQAIELKQDDTINITLTLSGVQLDIEFQINDEKYTVTATNFSFLSSPVTVVVEPSNMTFSSASIE